MIAFKDIVDIEKKTTALFIPNAIQVSTLHAKVHFNDGIGCDGLHHSYKTALAFLCIFPVA